MASSPVFHAALRRRCRSPRRAVWRADARLRHPLALPPRQRQLGDLADRVAVRLEAEAGRLGQGEPAGLRRGQVRDTAAGTVPPPDSGIRPSRRSRGRHAGACCGTARRRRSRSCALNAAASPATFRHCVMPPLMHDVRLQDVGRLVQQQVAETKQQPLVLPAGERDAAACGAARPSGARRSASAAPRRSRCRSGLIIAASCVA